MKLIKIITISLALSAFSASSYNTTSNTKTIDNPNNLSSFCIPPAECDTDAI